MKNFVAWQSFHCLVDKQSAGEMAAVTGRGADRQPPKCRGCSFSIHNIANRRKLGSRSTKHVISVLTEMVDRRYPGFRVTGTLLEADESYVCVPCFRRLEGVIKLRHQLADKQRKVIVDLEKSVCSGVISLSEREVTIPSSTRNQ